MLDKTKSKSTITCGFKTQSGDFPLATNFSYFALFFRYAFSSIGLALTPSKYFLTALFNADSNTYSKLFFLTFK